MEKAATEIFEYQNALRWQNPINERLSEGLMEP